jgi:cytochrome c-type biogenesis protein CcmH/NrfG
LARGTQHRKRRPAAHARAAARDAAVATPARKQKPPAWQEQLFFSRLRVHAKWVFVLLAVVFALGFVVFGVGSGSTGISDALQGAFNFGSGGSSISSLQKKAIAHPANPAGWRNLATAYEAKQRTADAISALQQYTDLRPKDTDALSELASEQTQLATTYGTDLQNAEIAAEALAPQAAFVPPSTTALGKAYADPKALLNPITAAVEENANTNAETTRTQLANAESAAETSYRKLVKLDPTDASSQLQLGQAAETAGDSATAITAYKAFLKLAPSDPLAGQVRKEVKALATPAASAGSSG